MRLMEKIRAAISENHFGEFQKDFLRQEEK
jgi:queuine/archaeosine tRNA-ribosyltransferase